MSLAKAQNLEEQLTTKEEAWAKKMAQYKTVDKNARELCEMILAKDRNEMVLGSEYSWSSLPTLEMIQKAERAFKEYNQKRLKLMAQVMDLAEHRREIIEGLTDQISQLRNEGVEIPEVEEITAAAETKKREEKALGRIPQQMKKAAEDQHIQVIIEDENDEIQEVEAALLEASVRENVQAKVLPNSTPIIQSQKKQKLLSKAKEKTEAHMIDLNDIKDKLTDIMLLVMRSIGEQGISKYSEIENWVIKEDPNVKKGIVRSSTQELTSLQVLDRQYIHTPLNSKSMVFCLSDIGKRIYFISFHQKPVLSEMEKIIREHDNLDHGYGILDAHKILEDSGIYDAVSSFNRTKAIPVPGGNGKVYVPDLIGQKGKIKDYYEYEMGTHTQTDFNAKCNKMVKLMRTLNFIAPNKEILLQKIKPKIDGWIKDRGTTSLKNIQVRATTVKALEVPNPKDPDAWLLIYDLAEGAAPIKCPE